MSIRIVCYTFLLFASLYNLSKYGWMGIFWSVLGVIVFTGLLIDEIRFLRNWRKKQEG